MKKPPLFEEGTKLIIRKLSACENPLAATPPRHLCEGSEQPGNVSLPVDYEIEGRVLISCHEGEPLQIFRVRRNETVTPGLTATSPVVSIDRSNNTFSTLNSIYQYEVVSQYTVTPVSLDDAQMLQ